MTGRARRQQRKRQRECESPPRRRGAVAWELKLHDNGWRYMGSGKWAVRL